VEAIALQIIVMEAQDPKRDEESPLLRQQVMNQCFLKYSFRCLTQPFFGSTPYIFSGGAIRFKT